MALDLVGQRFDRLIVTARERTDKGRILWLTTCDCGAKTRNQSTTLRSGRVRSCGCHRRKHGGTGTPEYRAFKEMRHRCTNAAYEGFARYGGRGIEMRYADFATFLADVGARPSARHSINRIDNDGHYEPGNCNWATPSEQASNRATNRLIEHGGLTLSLDQWGVETGFGRHVIGARLDVLGWTVERALTTPVQGR